MKAKIPITSKLSKKDLKELRCMIAEESHEIVEKREQLAMRHYMMLTAVVLSDTHGFGSTRLRDMFNRMSEIVQIHAEDDEEFWTHIEQRCKQLKLDKYFDL